MIKESDGQSSLLGDGECGYHGDWKQLYEQEHALSGCFAHTLQRNVLTYPAVDQGPWFGMVSYLGDDAFKHAKPKLIIWEIRARTSSPPTMAHAIRAT